MLIVVVSVLLAGCQLTGGGGKGAIPDSSSAFKGSDGLVISFFDDAPPEKVIPSSNDFKSKFNIAVLLENKGAADITCDNDFESCGFFLVFSKEPIKITSYLKEGTSQSVTGNLKDALETVDGKSKLIGKESYLSGGGAAMELSAEVEENVEATTTSLVVANACYPYKTSLSASVCVQTAHYTVPEESRTCELKTLSFSNQGAPVAVKKIEQESILSGGYVKPRFKIYISEVGKGTVIAKEPESLKKACTKETENMNDIIGKVTVDEATISNTLLDCEKKTITLTGIPKKDFVECIAEDGVFEAGASNNLVSPLKIVLGYGYQTAISKEVTIEVLDAPPKIRTFSMIPKTPKEGYGQAVFPNAELKIYVKAEDDKGLDIMEVKDKDGKHVAGSPHACNGALSCSNDFSATAPEKAGEVFIYRAVAVDTAGKPSDIGMVSGTVGGVIVAVSLPAEAIAGEEITITASAKSSYTALKSLELISVIVGKESVISTHDCKSQKTCSSQFKVKAPAEGIVGFYKARATDSKGATDESETKTVVGVLPSPG